MFDQTPNSRLGSLPNAIRGGGFTAKGVVSLNNNADHSTYGMHIQGAGDLFADIYHYERINKHHFLGMHVGNGGSHGWYEFRHDGSAFSNGAWLTSSDSRMKSDITPISGALDKLSTLGGYTYLKQGAPEAGVIAQEVEAVLPQAVTQTELRMNDGSLLEDARSVNINGVVALLIEALKEEQMLRIRLEEKVTYLEKLISGTAELTGD